ILFYAAAVTTVMIALSLHDALPISSKKTSVGRRGFLKEASAGAVALAGLVPAAMGQQTQLAQGRTGAAAPANTTGSYATTQDRRSEEHTSELQSPYDLVCRLLLEKK